MNCPKKQDVCGKCDEFSSSCYQLSPQRDIEQLKRQLEKVEEREKNATDILRGLLTALNTGDIQKDSLIHIYLRQEVLKINDVVV